EGWRCSFRYVISELLGCDLPHESIAVDINAKIGRTGSSIIHFRIKLARAVIKSCPIINKCSQTSTNRLRSGGQAAICGHNRARKAVDSIDVLFGLPES